jgi:biopolymer transport protein ExbD
MAIGKLPDDEPGSEPIFAEINITPLTDIFLVLLIIFMVSSSIMLENPSRAGVKVNLPKGAQSEIENKAKSLVVSVTGNGQIYAQGQPVSGDDLDEVFASSFVKDPNTQVIIEADEGVKHGYVVGVMERAKRVGLTKLAIATKGK